MHLVLFILVALASCMTANAGEIFVFPVDSLDLLWDPTALLRSWHNGSFRIIKWAGQPTDTL
jgi:hypothetical protein